MDYSLRGSSVHGIFQARILEWVAMFLTSVSFPAPPSQEETTKARRVAQLLQVVLRPRPASCHGDSVPTARRSSRHNDRGPIPSHSLLRPDQQIIPRGVSVWKEQHVLVESGLCSQTNLHPSGQVR